VEARGALTGAPETIPEIAAAIKIEIMVVGPFYRLFEPNIRWLFFVMRMKNSNGSGG